MQEAITFMTLSRYFKVGSLEEKIPEYRIRLKFELKFL